MAPRHDAPDRPTATLLVHCPDRRGIVAALAQLLYGHGANILDADQHTDPAAGQFFQRIRFDLAEIHTDRLTLENAIRETAERFAMRWRIAYADRRKRLAIFVSRYDHCLYDLLLRHRAGELACDVALVVSNHDTLGPVAAQFGLPFHVFEVTKGGKREAERRELELLEAERIDLVVLARYMQVLSPELCRALEGRAINIHHSFLPSFKGAGPYTQAHERGVKLIGATAHYVTADLDEGPIIEQDVVRVDHTMNPDDLMAAGRDVECSVLARAVRFHIERRVLRNGHRTVVFR